MGTWRDLLVMQSRDLCCGVVCTGHRWAGASHLELEGIRKQQTLHGWSQMRTHPGRAGGGGDDDNLPKVT